jgi:hypothetical protein
METDYQIRRFQWNSTKFNGFGQVRILNSFPPNSPNFTNKSAKFGFGEVWIFNFRQIFEHWWKQIAEQGGSNLLIDIDSAAYTEEPLSNEK